MSTLDKLKAGALLQVEVGLCAQAAHNVICAYVNGVDPNTKLLSYAAIPEEQRAKLHADTYDLLSGVVQVPPEKMEDRLFRAVVREVANAIGLG